MRNNNTLLNARYNMMIHKCRHIMSIKYRINKNGTYNVLTTTANCATIPQLFVEQLSFRPENLVVQQQDF